MSALILSTKFKLLHPAGSILCQLVLNGSGCIPTYNPFYFDNQLLEINHPVQENCCTVSVHNFDTISGNTENQRLNRLRLREATGVEVDTYSDNTNFECVNGICTFYSAKQNSEQSSDLITFTLIILFFCCWVQWSLHLTDYIKEELQSQSVFLHNTQRPESSQEKPVVENKLVHYDTILKSFGIVVLDVIWYVAWDKINTLSSTPDFYDDELENLLGSYNVEIYCHAIQHATLLIAVYLTTLVLAEQDLFALPERLGLFSKNVYYFKNVSNKIFTFCDKVFGNSSGSPRVQLTIRWLLEVLLLNAVSISIPWRLGNGIRRLVSFGAGCTIAFITGRDGFMLKKRFGLNPKQELAVMLIIIVFLAHAATFMIYPLFATSMTLLNRHALVIGLSLTIQVACLGKMFS